MINSKLELRVILIGGSSNVGKSTLPQSLDLKLEWSHVSTDSLARHPGRPWKTRLKTVPEDVAEHYLSLSIDKLLADILRHYRSMWQGIEALVTLRATDLSTDRLILEGSALWPGSVATLDLDDMGAIWLTAGNDLFQTRIHNASRFEEEEAREKTMTQKFLGRSLRYNEQMMDTVNRLGPLSIDVEATSSLDQLSDVCLELIRAEPRP